ncbi:MAG: hypothetical protein Q3971_05005 [Moraxella sp.]|nr:hypothetical protein [Moraxella sp.]
MNVVMGVMAGVLTAFVLFRWLFDDRADFLSCAKWLFMPDIVSMLSGRWELDFWGTTKVVFWVLMSVLMGYGTYIYF